MAVAADAHHRVRPPGPRPRHGRRRIPPRRAAPHRDGGLDAPHTSERRGASKRAAAGGAGGSARDPPSWAAHVTRLPAPPPRAEAAAAAMLTPGTELPPQPDAMTGGSGRGTAP